jgi:hypothetical protein
MSDGPYRTLKMRPHWRQVGKRAYQLAYDHPDVVDAICPALERDFAWEVPTGFIKELRVFCADIEPSLFGDNDYVLDRLKQTASGRGSLGNVIADCAAEALANGKNGDDAVRSALKEALTDRLVRHARAMEEHFLREAGTQRAGDLRTRLTNAIASSGASIDALAQKLTTQPASSASGPPKHQGLDDGVVLQ